jgi:ribosomal protein L37E
MSYGSNADVEELNFTIEFLRPSLWSSGQISWLQIRRPGFDSRHYQKKKCSGSGTGSTKPREYN